MGLKMPDGNSFKSFLFKSHISVDDHELLQILGMGDADLGFRVMLDEFAIKHAVPKRAMADGKDCIDYIMKLEVDYSGYGLTIASLLDMLDVLPEARDMLLAVGIAISRKGDRVGICTTHPWMKKKLKEAGWKGSAINALKVQSRAAIKSCRLKDRVMRAAWVRFSDILKPNGTY